MDLNNELSTTSSSSLPVEHQKALENYLPNKFLPTIKNVTTVRQALQTGTSSLAKISRFVGNEKTEALIKIYLVRMNELLDLKKGLSEEAISEIAATLVQDYYALTMVDVAFVLQQALKGKYGEFYDSLNMPKVLKWFEQYFDDRCNQAEQMSNENRQNQFNSLYGRERSSDQLDEQRQFSKQYAIEQLKEKHKINDDTPNKL